MRHTSIASGTRRETGWAAAPRRRYASAPLVVTIALLAAAVAGAPPVGAQSAPARNVHYHEGFWIGFGVGAGSGRLDCSRCGTLTPDDP